MTCNGSFSPYLDLFVGIVFDRLILEPLSIGDHSISSSVLSIAEEAEIGEGLDFIGGRDSSDWLGMAIQADFGILKQ